MINRYALQALRTKDGQSKASLAAAADISPQYYGELESGKRGTRPDPAVVRRLADALDVPMSAITCAHRPADAVQEVA